MPSNQAATVATYDFGAPLQDGEVLRFKTKPDQGGKVTIHFENDSTVAMQVSVDRVDAAGAVDDTPIDALDVPAKTTSDAQTLLIRAGQDAEISIRANGGTRGRAQIRPDGVALDIVKV